ncbi:hypothetical protein B0J11DRAFT_66398 [Dendryphion nanum]|uniref:Uncharacterized protein n=1 Tax=Dendryphion nanum TaxID=256645 RepID=A0A9P9DIC3_9PLEO|nr:hypothetical protein B0J11DRAFT_66398 [Dendryphion nanum]
MTPCTLLYQSPSRVSQLSTATAGERERKRRRKDNSPSPTASVPVATPPQPASQWPRVCCGLLDGPPPLPPACREHVNSPSKRLTIPCILCIVISMPYSKHRTCGQSSARDSSPPLCFFTSSRFFRRPFPCTPRLAQWVPHMSPRRHYSSLPAAEFWPCALFLLALAQPLKLTTPYCFLTCLKYLLSFRPNTIAPEWTETASGPSLPQRTASVHPQKDLVLVCAKRSALGSDPSHGP